MCFSAAERILLTVCAFIHQLNLNNSFRTWMLSGWNCSCASRTGSTGSLLWSSLICSLFERRTFMSGDTSITALFLFSSSKLHFVSFVTFLTETFPEVWFLHLMIISVSFGLKMFFIWINSFLLLWTQTDRRFVSSVMLESFLPPPPLVLYVAESFLPPASLQLLPVINTCSTCLPSAVGLQRVTGAQCWRTKESLFLNFLEIL